MQSGNNCISHGCIIRGWPSWTLHWKCVENATGRVNPWTRRWSAGCPCCCSVWTSPATGPSPTSRTSSPPRVASPSSSVNTSNERWGLVYVLVRAWDYSNLFHVLLWLSHGFEGKMNVLMSGRWHLIMAVANQDKVAYPLKVIHNSLQWLHPLNKFEN